jgi:hypothetical protein
VTTSSYPLRHEYAEDMNDVPSLPAQANVVFVGAGHNALVAAAYCSRRAQCCVVAATEILDEGVPG